MSTPSIRNQINHILGLLAMSKQEIEEYKSKHGVQSVKKSLRPQGNPTGPLPAILSVQTRRSYLRTGTTFFERARKLSGRKLLAELLNPEIILRTLDEEYKDMLPNTLKTVLAMLGKVYQGCLRAGWVKGRSLVMRELRQHVKDYREDGDAHEPRFGYREEDAPRIIALLTEKKSVFALPAEIALRCGLRLSEIAGMQSEHVDVENLLLDIWGKGGRERTVSIPADLVDKLNLSKQFLFNPKESWKSSFYQAVRKAARELGITISGVHRLRANYAQNEYKTFREQGMSDLEARKKLTGQMGHNRVQVTRSYVP